MKTPPRITEEYTILSSNTTPSAPIMTTKDKTVKQINCVVMAMDINYGN